MNTRILNIADKYRASMKISGGFVIFYQGRITGWLNVLKNPDCLIPGCIAIDVAGNQYKSVSGNQYDGARFWEQI